MLRVSQGALVLIVIKTLPCQLSLCRLKSTLLYWKLVMSRRQHARIAMKARGHPLRGSRRRYSDNTTRSLAILSLTPAVCNQSSQGIGISLKTIQFFSEGGNEFVSNPYLFLSRAKGARLFTTFPRNTHPEVPSELENHLLNAKNLPNVQRLTSFLDS
jgi:hypothetical protein